MFDKALVSIRKFFNRDTASLKHIDIVLAETGRDSLQKVLADGKEVLARKDSEANQHLATARSSESTAEADYQKKIADALAERETLIAAAQADQRAAKGEIKDVAKFAAAVADLES